jgi:RimJ/RimL family protein N-acetyltransferase
MKGLPLETNRIIIRRFKPSDLETFVAYRSAPEVSAFQGAFSLQRGRDLIAGMYEKPLGDPGWFQFAIEEKNSGALIGDLALNLVELPSTAELGFTLAPSHWGRGFALEAVHGLLELAFKTLELHRIIAFTADTNTRSQRLLDRLDFRLEGKSLESYEVNGLWINEFQYALLEREWLRTTEGKFCVG